MSGTSDNSFEQLRPHQLHLLQRGDHVKFHRKLLNYWHHAIVLDVDRENKKIKVIHLGANSNRSSGEWRDGLGLHKGRVQYGSETVKKDALFGRVKYPPTSCFTPDEVIRRAKSKLGEGGYDVFSNNCEHFVRWCKQDRKISFQVERQKSGWVRETVKKAWDIGSTLFNWGWTKFLNISTKICKIGGAVVSGMLEGIDTTCDIYGNYKNYKAGELTKKEFQTYVPKRIVDGACCTIGSVAGTVLGGPVGGIVGYCVGKAVGFLLRGIMNFFSF